MSPGRLKIACIASVSVEFRSKELSHEKRGGRGGEGGGGGPSFPSPTPSFLFWLSTQFRAGKIPFLGLSMFPNPSETLATQARLKSVY